MLKPPVTVTRDKGRRGPFSAPRAGTRLLVSENPDPSSTLTLHSIAQQETVVGTRCLREKLHGLVEM